MNQLNESVSKRELIAATITVSICLVVVFCLSLAPPDLRSQLLWTLLVLYLPTGATTMGQLCFHAGLSVMAEFFLRVSCSLNRIWLLVPGSYPAMPFSASANLLQSVLCDQQKYMQALSLNSQNIAASQTGLTNFRC